MDILNMVIKQDIKLFPFFGDAEEKKKHLKVITLDIANYIPNAQTTY